MSNFNLTFGELRTNRGFDGFLEVDVIGRVDLSKLSPQMRSNLLGAVRNGAAPVEYASSGKLASLYGLLCGALNTPAAYLSKTSRGLYIEDVDSDELFEELKALHMLSGNSRGLFRSSRGTVHEYRTGITYQALCNTLAHHRPVPANVIEAAEDLIKRGAVLTVSHTGMGTKAPCNNRGTT